jgi:hypothetical protein
MVRIPEKSVTRYQSTVRKIPEGRIYRQHYFKGGKFLTRLSLAHDQGKVLEQKKVVSGIKCDVLIYEMHVVEVEITVLPRTRLPAEIAKCK